MNGMTTLERAFELADQGLSIPEIRRTLEKDGYEQQQVSGTSIMIQLRKRILIAKDRSGQFGSACDDCGGASY